MDSDVWIPIATLVIGAGITYFIQSRQADKQHARTVELTDRQLEHARQQDERQHDQQIEQSGRQWRREKAFDLIVAMNEFAQAVNDVWASFYDTLAESWEWGLGESDAVTVLAREMVAQRAYCRSLSDLISDEALAQEIVHALTQYGDIVTADSETQAEEFEIGAASSLRLAIRHLGEYARSL
jgi:hypothetical protein